MSANRLTTSGDKNSTEELSLQKKKGFYVVSRWSCAVGSHMTDCLGCTRGGIFTK